MRKICYITGTRADFGLMKNTLNLVKKDDNLELEIIVTGMHLLKEYGSTFQEIVDSGFNIVSKVKVELSGSTRDQMPIAIGHQIIKFTKIFMSRNPDIVLLLGDRGEMLAGAIASLHANIPIAHIHGGELSGTIDEPTRHAISKLSHFHFTSTLEAQKRLIRMGENPKNVYVTGAPGLDEICKIKLFDRDTLIKKYGLENGKDFVLFLFLCRPILFTKKHLGFNRSVGKPPPVAPNPRRQFSIK